MSQKKIAAEMLKCGVSRIRITDEAAVSEALTRQDLRGLIRKGVISKVQKRGTSKFAVRKLKEQKGKGRRKGVGKRRGSRKTRLPPKRAWINTIRAVRSLLKELKKNNQIESRNYRKIYLMAKGGAFRSRKHMLNYLKEHEMLKERSRAETKKVAGKKERPKAKSKAKPKPKTKRIVKKPKVKTKTKAKKKSAKKK